MFSLITFTVFLILHVVYSTQPRHSPGNDAVLLSDVQVLTLHWDKETSGRRSAPQPQLQCIGGSGKSLAHTVRTVQCRNQGHDGRDYQWRCEAQLDPRIRLGRLAVSCEGYRDPNDEWVLVGSCGLEYELDLVPQPPQQQQKQVPPRKTTTTTTTTGTVPGVNNDGAFIVFMCALFSIFWIVVYGGCCVGSSSSGSNHYDRTRAHNWQPSTHRTSGTRSTPSPPIVYSPTQPTVVQPVVQPTVIVQQPPTVVHHYSSPPSSISSYMDGYTTATLLNRHVPTTTTTTTVHTESESDSWFPSFSSYDGGGGSSSSNDTSTTSVGFGGTKRR